VAMELKIR